METWNVTVMLRSPGAIGVFWLKEFQVATKAGATNSEVKDEWFKQYGPKWEFYRFGAIQSNFAL